MVLEGAKGLGLAKSFGDEDVGIDDGKNSEDVGG